MSSLDPSMRARAHRYEESGPGWLLFAGIMVVIVGVLNVIYGIAAIGNSSFFVNDQKYILSNLNTWGWVTLIIGVAADPRRVLDLARWPVRPLVRHHRGRAELDRRAALDPRLSVLVAGHLRGGRRDRVRPGRVRRSGPYGLTPRSSPGGARRLTSPHRHMRVPSLARLGRG